MIEDLHAAMNLLLDAASERFGPVMDLDSLPNGAVGGFYWTIEATDAYEVSDDAERRLTLGDLSDDVDEVSDLLTRDDGEVVLWHDLGHAIGLLGLLAYLDHPEPG